jgi:hypothetical protein
VKRNLLRQVLEAVEVTELTLLQLSDLVAPVVQRSPLLNEESR